MVRERVFVGKGGSADDHVGKGMSVGKGKVRSVNQLGMLGLHEGARAQNFDVGTGSGRANVGFGGMTSVGASADVGFGGMTSVGAGLGRAYEGQSGMLGQALASAPAPAPGPALEPAT